ncbi:MAG: M48 family metalloprotease [Burkholderiales bacterium]|nr:M48 family metalloprotease [Burkholderiales bacterium]
MKRHYLLVIFALIALPGCAVNPVSGRQDFVMMSESEEIALGRKSDLEVRKQYGVYDSQKLQQYVDQVGQRLAANSHRSNLQYHFTVVDSPEVNAFALPGGYIYITRGILPYLGSEAELAAVLGHEIGHVTARHAVKQYTAATAANIGVQLASIFVPEINTQAGYNLVNVAGSALLSGYGREHELEADHLGAGYLAKTGYDPHAMMDVLAVLKNQEQFDIAQAKQEHREPRIYHGLFASHPDSDTRLQQVVGEASSLAISANPVEGKAVYLEHVDGIAFGDSPSQGVVRNNEFLHAGLGIALRFPMDWTVRNSPKKLFATSGNAAIELTLVEHFQGSPSDYLENNIGHGQLTTLTIHGLQGAILAASPTAEAAAIRMGANLFVITGTARSAPLFVAARSDIETTIRSFHPLGASERKLAQGLKISIRHARSGDTFEGYAEKSPLGKNASGYLRLLNKAYPDGEPLAGEAVKLVE